MTVMQIINRIQRELRLPQSANITDSHARFVLDFMNKVYRGILPEITVWDALKFYTSFNTADGTSLYEIADAGGLEVDVIRLLQIGTYAPIEKKDDDDFIELKRSYTSEGQPLFYRHYLRTGDNKEKLQIELLPTPDAVYAVTVEGVVKPAFLTTADSSEIPVFDPDLIIFHTVTLLRQERVGDYSGDAAIAAAKLNLEGTSQGEGNWGDMESV